MPNKKRKGKGGAASKASPEQGQPAPSTAASHPPGAAQEVVQEEQAADAGAGAEAPAPQTPVQQAPAPQTPRKASQHPGATLSVDFDKLSVKSKTVGSFARPFSSHEERARNVGREGKPIWLLTNHFPINMKLAEVTHYDVQAFIPEFKRAPRKSDSELTTRAFLKAVDANPGVFPNRHGVVFDGVSNAFSAKPLKFANNARTFKVTVAIREFVDVDVDPKDSRDLKFTFTLTRAGTVPIQDAINEFQRVGETLVDDGQGGSKVSRHSKAVQATNIILGMVTRIKFTPIGRSHFPPKPGVCDLGEGKSLWVGTFKSVRVGWKLTLNVDMANKPGYDKGTLFQFISQLLSRDGRTLTPRELQEQLQKDFVRRRVSAELKGLKIRFYRPQGGPREYRANALTDKSSKQLILESEENGQRTRKTLYDYWLNEFGYKIQHPDLPCLHVGNVARTIYWPLERCEVKQQVCPRNKKLSDFQTSAMIKKTAVPPEERKRNINRNLQQIEAAYKNDPYAKAFGISVDDRMVDITGRVLNAPSVGYKEPNAQPGKFQQVQVRDGKWQMPHRATFISSQSLDRWGVLDLSGLRESDVDGFVDDLYGEGKKCEFKIDFPLKATANEDDVGRVEQAFVQLYQNIKIKSGGELPQIILVITSRRGPIRDHIKLLGDVHQQMPTQFVLRKNVERRNGQILHNICLKLNSKLGGTNQILHPSSLPDLLKRPVMFMGADVTHPPSGESAAAKPSIAAVVASCDPRASLYNTEVSLQPGDQAVEEITNLEAMTRSLLLKFLDRAKGRKPERIVFYRDGVSEGQFGIVLAKELTAIQRACKSLEDGYEPGITFVVAQKRHNTRLFPQDSRDGVGRNRNVPPGTVVDTVITHPTETSFFLASHEGIQGTTRPTHYHLLSDDNDFTSDSLQKLTYYMCHLYSRCERSVSYPSPTYYAHLAAFRARGHHNSLIDKGKGEDVNEWRKIEKMAVVNHFV